MTSIRRGILSLIARFYPALVQILLLRGAVEVLAPEQYRVWVIVLTGLVVFPAFDGGLGSTTIGVEARNDNPYRLSDRSGLIAQAMLRRLVKITVVSFVIVCAAPQYVLGLELSWWTRFVTSSLIAATVFMVIAAAFVEKVLLAQSRLIELAVASVIRATVLGGLLWALLLNEPTITGFLVAVALSSLVRMFLVLAFLVPLWPIHAAQFLRSAVQSQPINRKLATEARAFSVLQIAAVLALQADALIVASTEAGIELHEFVIWSRLLGYGNGLLSTASLPQWPLLAGERNLGRRARRVRRLAAFFAAGSVLIPLGVIAALILVPAVVEDGYSVDVPYASVWIAWSVASGFVGLLGLVLSSTGNIELQRTLMLRAAVFNFIVSLVLVQFWTLGPTIASILSVVLFMSVPGVRILRDLSSVSSTTRSFASD